MLIIALFTQVLGCTLTRTIDLKYYISSVIDEYKSSDATFDLLTCAGRSNVYGVKTTENTYTIIPELTLIWDVSQGFSEYTCTMSKSFFVPGRLTAATFNIFADDFAHIKINNIQVIEISTTAQCIMQNDINVLPYIKLGINSLFIEVTSTIGPGYFGYRIAILAYVFISYHKVNYKILYSSLIFKKIHLSNSY